MAKSEYIRMRIEPEVKETLQKAAEKDRRTLSDFVGLISTDWIEKNVKDDSKNV